MARDPAFLFYPADASEDTQFMNRLERGCYFDLLKAQKKFVRFTIEQLKKVLGKDFEVCWPALELILEKDELGYFIFWADDAIEKRKKHRAHQSENGKQGGRPKKMPEINPNETQTEPKHNPTLSNGLLNKKPLGNANAIENEEGCLDEEVAYGNSELFFYPGEPEKETELTELDIGGTVEFIRHTAHKVLTHRTIRDYWEAFKIQYFTSKRGYDGWTAVKQHFRNWLKTQNHGNTGADKSGDAKLGTSEARTENLKAWGTG